MTTYQITTVQFSYGFAAVASEHVFSEHIAN